ncbi:FCD domain-containing protein [Ramlibacter terrae]|uniref:FCD domain-containing protein n=1 Tax=Ramlibacter terrae TaxID=2732511 RepID=A0ABX6P178_9BURK|nr:FCD domain-containing protein [Ramlibacter terrae]
MPLPRTSLSDLTYETLKERILDQKLAPGERLNIDALTRSLGVSSSPVREALVRLEAEKLVVLELYAGYTVAPHPTRDYLVKLYDFRILLEGHCARVGAARRDPATLAVLQALVKRMAGTKRPGTQYREYKKLGQADAQFHQAIVDSAGNEVLSEVYASKQTHLLMSRLFRDRPDAGSPAAVVMEEHREVLAAYEAGDGAMAGQALVAHRNAAAPACWVDRACRSRHTRFTKRIFMNDPRILTRRRWLANTGLAGLALSPRLPAHAQDAWPTRPLRLVVPFAPGGSSEIVARALAGEMGKTIGQNVFVDNKPGAAGNIAMQEVANAGDGHTLVLGHIGTLAVNPYIFARLPYDAEKDFAPISLTAKVPSLYVVHPDLPVKDLKEFVAYAKAKPGQLNYGSAGNGSAGHPAMEYLKMASGTFLLHVPYRGTGPMLTDLMAGRLHAASVGAPALLQFIKAGKLRCIATGTSVRLPQLPDVPTVAEQGYKGFEMTQWYGLMAPSRLPQAHIDKLEAEAIKATRSKIVTEKLGQETAIAVGSTRAEFATFIRQEQARWKPVIARAQIKPEGT